MKILSVIGILILNAGLLFSQDSIIHFTLDEAQKYAIEHNKNLINANKDVLIARQQIREAAGSGFPQLNATVDYSTNFNYEVDFGFSGGGTEPPDIDYSLLYAGDYEVLNAIGQMFGPSESSSIVMEDQANANVQVSQLIFSGQYWMGIQLAKVAKQIAEKNVTLTELDVKEGVTNYYYMMLITQNVLEILDENILSVEDILKHTENMFRAGMSEQTDVDQFKVNLSQLQNARKNTERNLELAHNMFRFTLGLGAGQEFTLTDSLPVFIDILDSSLPVESALDIESIPSYQMMQAQEELSLKSVKLQKWAYTPTLAGYYNYREKLMTSGFDLSPRNSAGLTLNVPIFSGFTRNAQLSRAKIELDKASRSKSLMEEQLQLQDDQLNFELITAYENYQTQKESVDVAKRVYDNINNKYKQGIVSSLDLTQANTNYLSAENSYVSSIMDLLQAKLRLDKLYNKL